LPVDSDIQIAFDRYLLPASVTRQSVPLLVTDATGTPVAAPIVRYDPVARVVTLSRPNETWLTPGQPYKLRLTLPPSEDIDDRGLRAIDRATLDPNQPLEFAFFAAAASGRPNEKTVSFCGDVLPILSMKCTAGVCHASDGLDRQGRLIQSTAAAGLVLDSFVGIQKTALLRVANSANTGGRSGDPGRPRGVFGVDMPIIDPGSPDTSWLLYKIELAKEPAIDSGGPETWICNAKPDVDELALPTIDPLRYDVRVRQPQDLERSILSDYVPGREMPYPSTFITSSRQQALTFDERERIRLWIAQGANMTECGGCTPVAFNADAGEPDADAPDAGADADAATDDAASDAADQ
jgi:hypothetical protein